MTDRAILCRAKVTSEEIGVVDAGVITKREEAINPAMKAADRKRGILP